MNKTSPSTIEYRTNDKIKRGDERNEQPPRSRRSPINDTRKKVAPQTKRNAVPTLEMGTKSIRKTSSD